MKNFKLLQCTFQALNTTCSQWPPDCTALKWSSLQGYFFFNELTCFYLFIYLFLAVLGLHFVRGLSLVVASGGHSSSRCAGLSLSRPLLLRSTGSRRAGSAAVAHGPSCSAACGILPDQGSNPCPPHWQADSQPLRHQGSPQTRATFDIKNMCIDFGLIFHLKCN